MALVVAVAAAVVAETWLGSAAVAAAAGYSET